MDPAIQPAPQNPPPAAPPPAAPAAPPAPAPGEALAKPVQTVAQPPAAKPGEQPAPAAKPGDKPGDKPAEKPAPVAVDAKWRPPAVEGVQRDEAVLAKTAQKFAELGLNTEQAAALVAYSDELAKATTEAQTKATAAAEEKQLREQNAGWWKELQADKEIGAGSDDGLKTNLVIANKAVDALFGDEGRKAIQEAGLTNWPPLVRAMVRAGAKIGEDTLLDGNKAAPPLPSEFEKLKTQYPKSPELWDPTHPEFRGRK
jgi:hypothetical protein